MCRLKSSSQESGNTGETAAVSSGWLPGRELLVEGVLVTMVTISGPVEVNDCRVRGANT